MSLSERSRSSLYTGLSSIADEEAVAEMLANFPTRDVDDPITKDHLDSKVALLRSELHVEIAGLRAEIKDEIGGLRAELKGEIAGLRTELKGDIAELRTELKGDITELRGDLYKGLAAQQTHLETAMRQQLYWLVGTMITLFALCTTLIVALH